MQEIDRAEEGPREGVGGLHLGSRRRGETGDVQVEKGRDEGEKLENFFYVLFEYLTNFEKYDAMNFLCNLPIPRSTILVIFLLLLLLLLLKLCPMASIGWPFFFFF